MTPDEKALRRHLDLPVFRMAAIEKRFRLLRVTWPHVFLAVRARDRTDFSLRFDCSGYPAQPPTAGLWDPDRNQVLAPERWPRHGGGRVKDVFRLDWKGGTALYLPCDRETIPGHNDWQHQMPSKLWRPADGLLQYVELVHELLNSTDYQPPAGTAA